MMKDNRLTRMFMLIMLSTLITLMLSCAALQEFTNVQKPIVSLANVRVTDISFEDLQLAFDIDIENPNAISASLAGFDYDLLLAGSSFVKGQQANQMTIASLGKSTVQVPVTLNFNDLYSMFQSLKNQDSTNYKINTGLTFNLPLLGETRIPLSHEGQLPLLKLPRIKVDGLQLKNLTLTGANLDLKLNVDNPNVFSLILDKLQYDFKVNQKSWINGVKDQALTISQKKSSVITIPMSLNFLQMGTTVYNIIAGNESIDYSLNGKLDLNTSLPLLKQASIPIDLVGKLNIRK